MKILKLNTAHIHFLFYMSCVLFSCDILAKASCTFLRMGPDYFKDEPAPNFTLKDIYDNAHELKNYRGKRVILCFFDYQRLEDSWGAIMKADLVRQLTALRDAYPLLQQCNFEIIAITPSYKQILNNLIQSHRLPFHFLCDNDRKIAFLYGATEFGFVIRSTLIIDELGTVVNVTLSDDSSDHLTEIFFYALQHVSSVTKKDG
jgi:peroxiredoxin Q/BCP